jgi:hypothetical protein
MYSGIGKEHNLEKYNYEDAKKTKSIYNLNE